MRQPFPSEAPSITSNSLGELLDQIENLQGKVGLGIGGRALEILVLCDRSAVRFVTLAEQGIEVRAEQAQFEHIVETFRKQAGIFLREVGGAGAVEKLRRNVQPPEENWWWWPERIVAGQRSQSLKGFARGFGILAGVLLLLTAAYQIFFKPDPKMIAVMNAGQNAQQSFIEGDPNVALAELEKGLDISPDDAELLILKGCILSLQDSTAAEAQVAFDRAEKVINNREFYFMSRAQSYYMIGQLDRAREDALAAIEANPKSAKAYLVYGQILETARDQQGAYDAYEKASGLAGDDATVAAQARIKMGMLLQVMGLFSTEDFIFSTPTP